MVTLARDIRTTRIPKLEAERFHLVVLGEFNHGKSTFVNALLGQDVLPTGITPTTASINHVVYAPNPTARVVLTERREQVPRAERSSRSGSPSPAATRARSRTSSSAIRATCSTNNVVLVDTPGVNDLNEQRAEVTYGYVPRADAVVFLLDAGQALKDSEREFLRSRVLESARDRLIFVLGKMDMLNADERTAVVDYVKQGPRADHAGSGRVPAVREGLGASRKDPQSGMPELLAYLERFLARDRAQVILDNAAADAARTASYLENNLGVRMRAYDLDIGELEQRIAAVREQLDTSKRKLDELHVRIDADAESIKNQVGLDLEAFAKAFVAGAAARRSTRSTPTTSRRTCPRSSRTSSRSGPSSRARSSPRCSSTSPKRSSRSRTRTSRRPPATLAERLGPERHRRSTSRSTRSSTTSASTRSARSARP